MYEIESNFKDECGWWNNIHNQNTFILRWEEHNKIKSSALTKMIF